MPHTSGLPTVDGVSPARPHVAAYGSIYMGSCSDGHQQWYPKARGAGVWFSRPAVL